MRIGKPVERPARRWDEEWRRGRGGPLGLVLFVVGITAGCSGETKVETFPVRGKVLFRGEPAAGAFVVLHPVGVAPDPQRPTAQVRPDGSFDVATFTTSDGAPAGSYAVTVEWYRLVKKGTEFEAGPNVIPRPYSRPDTTPLQVTIAQSPNELEPFQIR